MYIVLRSVICVEFCTLDDGFDSFEVVVRFCCDGNELSSSIFVGNKTKLICGVEKIEINRNPPIGVHITCASIVSVLPMVGDFVPT